MRKIAVVTDSNSGITQAEALQLGVYVVPMPFFIDGALFLEDISLSQAEFYRQLEQNVQISTSMPEPGRVLELWNMLLQDYDEIVHIPMSSGLSGTCQAAAALASDYGGRVRVVDNKRISCTQKQSVLDALTLAAQGRGAGEIGDILERDALEASIYIAVDTMQYLKKGGRVTPAAASIAAVLNIKPLLQIQGGRLDAFAKPRGMKQAKARMLEAVEADLRGRFAGRSCLIRGAYTCTEEEAAAWRQELQARFPDQAVSLDRLALSVACHIGPGALAAVCMARLPEVEE